MPRRIAPISAARIVTPELSSCRRRLQAALAEADGQVLEAAQRKRRGIGRALTTCFVEQWQKEMAGSAGHVDRAPAQCKLDTPANLTSLPRTWDKSLLGLG